MSLDLAFDALKNNKHTIVTDSKLSYAGSIVYDLPGTSIHSSVSLGKELKQYYEEQKKLEGIIRIRIRNSDSLSYQTETLAHEILHLDPRYLSTLFRYGDKQHEFYVDNLIEKEVRRIFSQYTFWKNFLSGVMTHVRNNVGVPFNLEILEPHNSPDAWKNHHSIKPSNIKPSEQLQLFS